MENKELEFKRITDAYDAGKLTYAEMLQQLIAASYTLDDIIQLLGETQDDVLQESPDTPQ